MANKRILPAEQERQFLEDAAELLASGLFMGDIEQLQNAENIEQELLPILKQITQEVQEPITGREYSSKIIPGSPDFDFSAYKRAIKAAGGFDALLTEALTKPLKENFSEAIAANIRGLQKLGAAMSKKVAENKEVFEGIKSFSDTARTILLDIKTFFASDEYKAFKERTEAIANYCEKNKDALKELADTREDLQSLAFFIQSEQETDPDFSTTPLKEILTAGLDEQGHPTGSKYKPLIERALQRQAEFIAEFEPVKEIEQAAKELPRIIAKNIDKIEYPTDKVNNTVWKQIVSNDNGQMMLNIDTNPKNNKKDYIVCYSINFDALENDAKLTSTLSQYDKLLFIIYHSLLAQNEYFSLSQVYRAMGHNTDPNTDTRDAIFEKLRKMRNASIVINNLKEVKASNGKYACFDYEGSLLPFEVFPGYINGQYVDTIIHPLRESPLMTFARQRKQITTFSPELLRAPISATESNLTIQDYLLDRIAQMKNPKRKSSRKMKFETIYRECNITTTKQKQRAPEKLHRYLDHYVKCNWIKGYTEDADGITIILK